MYQGYELLDGQLRPSDSAEAPIRVYTNPTEEERRQLVGSGLIDEYDLHSALDPEEVSRVESENGRLLILWKRPNTFSLAQNRVFEGASVGIVMQASTVTLILGDEALPFSDRRFRPGKTLHEFVIHFLLNTVHHYLGHLRAIKAVSRELQVKLNTSMENAYFLQMFALGESLIYYVNAIEANGGALARLSSLAEKQGFTADERQLLDDAIIENRQCLRQAEIYAQVLSGLMDARGNIINNNMNTLLKNLTIINIVFLPLNLIASMFGMSEFSAWSDKLGMPHWLAYSLFTAAMVAMGWATWKLVVNRIEHVGRN